MKRRGPDMTAQTIRPMRVRDRRHSMERKLAAYAVTSGAVLASAGQASADYVYSGIRDVPVGNQQTVNLNLNDTGALADAVTDYVFRHTNSISGLNQTLTLAVTPSGTNQVVVDAGGFAAALNAGDSVSAASTLAGGARTMATYRFKLNVLQSSSGPWRGATNKYLGFRFEIPGDGFHFGWARIDVSAAASSTATAVIHDWAYES